MSDVVDGEAVALSARVTPEAALALCKWNRDTVFTVAPTLDVVGGPQGTPRLRCLVNVEVRPRHFERCSVDAITGDLMDMKS